MEFELEMQIDTYVESHMRRKVREVVKDLEKQGYLVVSVDNNAIRYFDRSMNRGSYPLCLIE